MWHQSKKGDNVFCDSTKQDRQLQFNVILEKNIGEPSRVFDVSKTGVANLQTLAALVAVKARADQVQVMTLLTLCVKHFTGALGNQLAELQENKECH